VLDKVNIVFDPILA